jgi:transcription elongation factor SPT6
MERDARFFPAYVRSIGSRTDVKEYDKPSDSELGTMLEIKDSGRYSDLDELLVNHVGAIVRKLDTLMQHEKYRPENELGE